LRPCGWIDRRDNLSPGHDVIVPGAQGEPGVTWNLGRGKAPNTPFSFQNNTILWSSSAAGRELSATPSARFFRIRSNSPIGYMHVATTSVPKGMRDIFRPSAFPGKNSKAKRERHAQPHLERIPIQKHSNKHFRPSHKQEKQRRRGGKKGRFVFPGSAAFQLGSVCVCVCACVCACLSLRSSPPQEKSPRILRRALPSTEATRT
jgi:hypothetical protein